jgi:hypothetical protein
MEKSFLPGLVVIALAFFAFSLRSKDTYTTAPVVEKVVVKCGDTIPRKRYDTVNRKRDTVGQRMEPQRQRRDTTNRRNDSTDLVSYLPRH